MATTMDTGHSDAAAFDAWRAVGRAPWHRRLTAWWRWRRLERHARAMDATHPIATLVTSKRHAELDRLVREVWGDD